MSNFIKSKKSYFTILESLIAMFLLSMLLVIVFGFFGELSTLNKQSKKTVEESFHLRYVESRLAYIFSHIVNENLNGKKFYFLTLSDEASHYPSLIFTFDNDVTLDPHVSGDVLARLFVDEDKRLSLAIWPIMDSKDLDFASMQSHQKIEYLLSNVKNFRMTFLSAPDAENTILKKVYDEKNAKEPPRGVWLTQWEKEYKQMPVIIKIEVTLQDDNKPNEKHDAIFSFVLPSSKHPIKFVPK